MIQLLDLEVSSACEDNCPSQNHFSKDDTLPAVMPVFLCSPPKDGLHLNDEVTYLYLEESLSQDQRLFAAVWNGVKVHSDV